MDEKTLYNISEQMIKFLAEFEAMVPLQAESLVIIGGSTSEVIGENIGTAGALDVAEALYRPLDEYKNRTGVSLAFQCCEHLNRALVIENNSAVKRGYEPVTVIPVQKAGGALATCAYHKMENPVIVEAIKADAGIDIGNTMIGMHLKPVAVPLRASIRFIGKAHITMAKTRPKLIGGARARYE